MGTDTQEVAVNYSSILKRAANLAEQLTFLRERQAEKEARKFPEQEFDILIKEKLLHVTLPGEAMAFGTTHTARLLQLLKLVGKGNLSVGRIYEGHINALFLIHLFGTAAQRERWYADVKQGQHMFGVWNTQAQGGVRIVSQGGGRFILEGAKTFCSGAKFISRPIVPGKLIDEKGNELGWQMCIVSLDQFPAVPVDSSFWQPLGMHASVSHKIDFSGISINESDLLGKPEDYHQQPYFSGGAIRFAAVQLGGAEAVFDATRHFLQKLKRIEDPYQRMRLGEMAMLIESGNLWINQAANMADSQASSAQIINYANMTRTAIERICLETMRLSERCVGARGLLYPEPFARLHADLTTYLRQPAPDAALALIGEFVSSQDSPAHALWSDDI